ncbi:cytochrome P450 [Cadophora sp. DSE1049]|nr:cytochrome P450 [Cadophora sp. DSE1049]
MQDVFSTCMTNIGAGSDTTSISLGSVIYNLCRYPDAMKALKNEIESMEKEGGISNPVTFNEAQQMPYLQAVIKEALRMHPATGLPLGRVMPAGGKVIAGRQFPEGVSPL